MKPSASEQISERIGELGDWRGTTLSRVRELIKEADPEILEEWKWAKASSPGDPGLVSRRPRLHG
jgi:hypothetical protein